MRGSGQRWPLFLLVAFAIAGCSGSDFDDDCSSEMDDYARPSSISRANVGDYHSEIWYYAGGSAVGFTWEDGVWGSCEVSTYSTR
jgi:hypothetical protein